MAETHIFIFSKTEDIVIMSTFAQKRLFFVVFVARDPADQTLPFVIGDTLPELLDLGRILLRCGVVAHNVGGAFDEADALAGADAVEDILAHVRGYEHVIGSVEQEHRHLDARCDGLGRGLFDRESEAL